MSRCLLYLALLVPLADSSFGQTITKLNFVKDHLNKRLDGYIFELHTNLSLHQCSKECMLTLGCKSFNSQTSTNTCELNWVSLGDVVTDFLMVNNSWNYFDVDAWPREMVAMCHANMCPQTHRCISGEPVQYCHPHPKPECIDYLTDANGYIMNRNFPNGFPPTNCSWQITVPDGWTVEINFVNISLGPPSDCDRNYLTVYDGHNRTDPVLGTVCGNTTGAPVFSSFSNKLLVTMITDEMNLEESGFKAFYQMEYYYYANDNSGYLPYGYNSLFSGSVYKWLITVSEGYRVLLNIIDKDLNYCTESVIHDGTSTELGSFCSAGELIYGSRPVMLIKIPSESTVFSASYYSGVNQPIQVIDDSMTSHEMVGMILSPNYPAPYTVNLNMWWYISVPSDYNILFHTIAVEFEICSGEPCRCDSIEIYDGIIDANLTLALWYCRVPTPSFYVSQTNTATVHFTSDWSFEYSGFRLDYIAVLL